jgi:hypothetical protein
VCRERADDAPGTVGRRRDERPQHGCPPVAVDPERLVVLAPTGADDGQLGALRAVQIANRQPVVGLERDDGRRARANAIRLAPRIERQEPRDEQART